MEDGWKDCKLAMVYNEKDVKKSIEKESMENRVSIQSKKLVGALAKGHEQAKYWVIFYQHLLMNGCEDYMIERLLEKAEKAKKQTSLRELYSYFDSRRERIRYAVFKEKGYPIGSGAIESANKYAVQSRTKQAGMRWSIPNANAVIQLRNNYISGEWDNLWPKMA